MKYLSGRGFFVAGILWFVIVFIGTLTLPPCVNTRSCDGGDMILSAVMGAGALVPAYYGTLVILGAAFESLIDKDND